MISNAFVFAIIGVLVFIVVTALLIFNSAAVSARAKQYLCCCLYDDDELEELSLVGMSAAVETPLFAGGGGAAVTGRSASQQSRAQGSIAVVRDRTVSAATAIGAGGDSRYAPRSRAATATPSGVRNAFDYSGTRATAVEVVDALDEDGDSGGLCGECDAAKWVQRGALALVIGGLFAWQFAAIAFGAIEAVLPSPNVSYAFKGEQLTRTLPFMEQSRLPSCDDLNGTTVGFLHPSCDSSDTRGSFQLPRPASAADSPPGDELNDVFEIFAVYGYEGQRVTEKCCAKISVAALSAIGTAELTFDSKQNFSDTTQNCTASTGGSCDRGERRRVLSCIPMISASSSSYLALRNDSVALRYLEYCPQLPGRIIPQGFAAMAISSVVGTVINILLNLLQYARDRYCPFLSFTRCFAAVRRCCSADARRRKRMYGGVATGFDDGVDGIPDKMLQDIGGALPVYCRLFGVSSLQVFKTIVVVVTGFVLACITAHNDASDGSWPTYLAFFTMLINGSTTQNVVDFISAVIVSEIFVELMFQFSTSVHRIDREFVPVGKYLFASVRSDVWQHAHDYILQDGRLAAVTALLCALVFLCPAVTNWFGGMLLFFLPVLVLCIGFAALGATVVFAIVKIAKITDKWNGATLTAALLVTSITLNFILTIIARFPFNLSVMAVGESSYTRFITTDDDTVFAAPSLFLGASWLDATFYLIQMGSQNCYYLRLYTSLHHGIDIVLTFL